MAYLILFSILSFSMDIASFRNTDSTSYVEVYYSVGYRSLKYVEDKGRWKAKFKVTINIREETGKDSLKQSFQRISYITNLQDAEDRDIRAADLIPLTLPSNQNYTISLTIEDENSKKKETKTMMLQKRLWNNFCLSDIQLSHTMKEEEKGKFVKNGYKLVPYPERIFGISKPIMNYYLEVYHISGNKGEIFYRILDDNGKVYREFPSKSFSNLYKNFVEAGGINVISFPEGKYIFQVGVSDGKDTLYSSKPFVIYKKKRLIARKKMLPEYLPYAKFINYIASPKEMDMYNALSDSGKWVFLERFWAERDPTPSTPKNEYLEEFIKRIKYADEHYTYINIKGRETARGRIYIKYGPPDEIVSRIHEVSVKPYEIWKYYSGNEIVFIFSDFSYSGRYDLIYSNLSSEPYDPHWKMYILSEDAHDIPERR